MCAKMSSFFFPSSSGVKRLNARQERLSLDMEYQAVNVLSTHTLHLFHGFMLYKVEVRLVMKRRTAVHVRPYLPVG